MFDTDGLIVPPRVSQPDGAPYGKGHIPEVKCGTLAPRNKRYFNIGMDGGATEAHTVPLACHHVVGWKIICGFWNELIKNKEFNVARDYLALFGVNKGSTDKLESQIKAKKFKYGAEWERQLCWKPNNIVRGPEKRSDDPNDNVGLENKIDFQNARADIYGGRVAGLVGAGRDMCQYISSGNVAKAKEALKYFTSIRNKEIMEWDESIWAVDSKHSDSGYSRTPSLAGGFDVFEPKWRIHISKA